jgi:hypothetical protein
MSSFVNDPPMARLFYSFGIKRANLNEPMPAAGPVTASGVGIGNQAPGRSTKRGSL